MIPPALPDIRLCRRTSDLPAKTANVDEGTVDVMRWSLPIFPQESLVPTILGWEASSMRMEESRSMPAVTPGKL